MWIEFCNWFTKITGWVVQFFCFRTKIYYEDPKVQKRHIKGSAIIVSNHTSIFDYAVYLFVFFSRTIRVQMAEVLFEKKLLGAFLKCLGGIRVNRFTHDLRFISQSERILKAGGVVGIFPEGRLPRKGEQRPLPFSTGAAFLALSTNSPVIPVYTNGSYFCRKRARVIIGTPINLNDFIDPSITEKENLKKVTEILSNKIIKLEKELNEKTR